MLIAPIFHNNYLTPKRADSQQKLSETSLNNSVKSNDGNTSGTYSSIFKSAFNRGTELLKNTFFTAPLVTNFPQQQQQQSAKPSNNHQESPITISSRSSTPSSSSSSDTESEDDGSSPDSIKTELMLFKPITREPRTNSANPQLIRVPSIRSTSSSNSSVIHSPCPSPFNIPLTPCRLSAFSFVVQVQSSSSPQPPPPPKTNKRKCSKLSPEKKSKELSPKRQKKLDTTEEVKIAKRRQSRIISAAPVVLPISEKTENVRKTRSKKQNSEPLEAKPIKEFKSPQKKPAKRNSVPVKPAAPAAVIDDSLRRVTRSMKN